VISLTQFQLPTLRVPEDLAHSGIRQRLYVDA
jgi:hypothetical protein